MRFRFGESGEAAPARRGRTRGEKPTVSPLFTQKPLFLRLLRYFADGIHHCYTNPLHGFKQPFRLGPLTFKCMDIGIISG